MITTSEPLKTIKAHMIRLHPTPEQEAYLRRAAGTRRFIFNWGLQEWNRQYVAYKAEQETVPAEQHTPSTKRCHRCRHMRDIDERERTCACFNPDCGWVGDRYLNAAALTILEEALRLSRLVV